MKAIISYEECYLQDQLLWLGLVHFSAAVVKLRVELSGKQGELCMVELFNLNCTTSSVIEKLGKQSQDC